MSEVVAYRPLRAPTPPQIAIGLSVLGVLIGAPLAPLGGLLLAGFAYGLDGWLAAHRERERQFQIDEESRAELARSLGAEYRGSSHLVKPKALPTRTAQE